VLIPALIALFLAISLDPGARLLTRRHLRRGIAILVTLGLVAAVYGDVDRVALLLQGTPEQSGHPDLIFTTSTRTPPRYAAPPGGKLNEAAVRAERGPLVHGNCSGQTVAGPRPGDISMPGVPY
jgi:hypothetical protein